MIPLLMVLQALATGSIEGRVTSTVTQEPIVGALLSVQGLERRAATNDDGRFTVAGLSDGRWVVQVTAEGFEGRSLAVWVSGAGSTTIDFELDPVEAMGSPAHVRGVVREQGRLAPVRFATVRIRGRTGSATTDESGHFSLQDVPPGDWSLRVDASSFEPADTVVRVARGAQHWVEILLEPAPMVVDGVTVASGTRHAPQLTGNTTDFVVDSLLLDLMPAIVERDVMRGVQATASVTPSSDFSTALFVRGGTPDQTRIMLDGAVVHNPYHLAGFVSAFAPSATDVAVLQPGALPSSSPSALSGVLAVRTREGQRDSVRVEGAAGLLSTHLAVTGPLPVRGDYFVSGRRTYVDAATAVTQGLGMSKDRFPYGFWDGLGKLTIDVAHTGSIALTAYSNKEVFQGTDGGGRGRWGSDLLSLRYRQSIGSGAQATAGLALSTFGGSFREGQRSDGESLPVLDTHLETWAADGEVLVPLKGHTLSVGARWERNRADHQFDLNGRFLEWVPSMRVGGEYGDLALYLRDRFEASHVVADIGVRAVRTDTREWHILPRARLALNVRGTSLGVGGGRYVQDGWSLRNEEGVKAAAIGYDLAVSRPPGVPVRSGWDAELDVGRAFRSGDARITAFVKRLENVPLSPPWADPVVAPLILPPDSLRPGKVRVEGVEVQLRAEVSGASLIGSYRLQREAHSLLGTAFTPRNSRRHRVMLVGSRPFGEREAAFALTWMTGIASTPIATTIVSAGAVDAQGRVVPTRGEASQLILGESNSIRLKGYLRMDVDVRGAWDWTLFGRDGVLEPYFSVLNVFNNRNMLYAHSSGGREGPIATFGPQLPLLPTFGVRWRF